MPNPTTLTRKERVYRGLAMLCVAVALAWPAILNGYPLLFPDSITYLGQSHGILARLRGHTEMPLWSYDSLRSETFSSTLAFLHHGPTLWPIVAFQALLTAWILWLVARVLCARAPLATYLAISAVIASVSGAAWYVSCVMPDSAGPLLYLSIFLLVMAWERLQRWEQWTLTAFSLWAITTHTVYPILTAGLCIGFAVLLAAGWPGMLQRGRRVALCAGLIALALGTQVMIHARLYGKPSVSGHAPAFLMARLLADGPARLYLQQHCSGSTWVICKSVDHLPADEEVFLWDTRSVWQTVTPLEQEKLRGEQIPLLLATLRTYPREQMTASLRNFGQSLITLGPANFNAHFAYAPAFLNFGAEGLASRYPPTKQAHALLPEDLCRIILPPVVIVATFIVLALLPGAWRRREDVLLALAATVLFILPANAFVSGVTSGVFARYQGRVVWMIILLAGLMAADALASRMTNKPS